jgi:putative transposase
MGNVLDKLPQKERKEAAPRLRAVYLAGSRVAAARLAHDLASEWQKSYPKAATCLLTDLDACLRYFDYPREHWKHLRTTNPVESTFSTMRLRTDAAKRFRTARSGVHLVSNCSSVTRKPGPESRLRRNCATCWRRQSKMKNQ